MKAKLPPNLKAFEKKAIEAEIKRQCVKQVEKYELELDTVTLYTLNEIFGFGKERLDRFYSEMFRLRKEMKERYENGDDEGIGDFAMLQKLKEKGIDVEQMYKEQEVNHRFKVKLS